jgi:hypothetical protein
VADIYITEFQASGNSVSGAQLQVGVQPAVAMQKVSFTTSTQSALFDARTVFIRLHPTADCHVIVGTSPTATTNHMPMLADSTEYFGVLAGMRLAVIAA